MPRRSACSTDPAFGQGVAPLTDTNQRVEDLRRAAGQQRNRGGVVRSDGDEVDLTVAVHLLDMDH